MEILESCLMSFISFEQFSLITSPNILSHVFSCLLGFQLHGLIKTLFLSNLFLVLFSMLTNFLFTMNNQLLITLIEFIILVIVFLIYIFSICFFLKKQAMSFLWYFNSLPKFSIFFCGLCICLF
jgi:uncharacterized protein YqhQ